MSHALHTPASRWRPGLRRLRSVFTAAGLAAVTATGLVATSAPAEATPIRGNTPWSVILCRFADVTATPQPPSFFARFVGTAGAGQGGLNDYFRAVSGGRVSPVADVHGWYRMSQTKAQLAGASRWDRISACVNAAAAGGYAVPAGNRIMAIINSPQDSGAAGGRVLLDPNAWNVAFAAHEMSHGYGLGHSFSNDLTYRNASWSAPGEYDDPWDLMSAMNVFTYASPTFGATPPGFAGYHLDELGWLPANAVRTFGAAGEMSGSVTLNGLYSGVGTRLLRIPFDPGDLFSYYTVEFRPKAGVDRAIPGSTVLIHSVKNGTPTLLRQLGTAGRNPVQWLGANGVTVRITSVGTTSATVAVTSAMPQRCLMGWVWRDARPGDVVCVTGATRAQVAADNAVRASRWVPGPYGPHTCINGYVWREAFPGDDVCVTGAQRTQAASDNAAAASRRNPARFVYGPNTCAPGYVWRGADASDYVCVTGATRAQAAADNAVRASRWVVGPYGPHTCINGYVWREAWPSDDVCVTGTVRAQARADNLAAPSRVARAGG